MLIHFCCAMLNFEHRHRWQVSSMLEQHGRGLPDIFLDVAILAGDKNPLRFPPELCQEINPKVRLQYFETDYETFARRGYVRNEQVKRALAAKADWIFFGDADKLYHPRFFAGLAKKLRERRIRNSGRLITSRMRHSLYRDDVNKLIAEHPGPYIKQAYKLADRLPREWKGSMVLATGGMQVARPERIVEVCNGYYCEPGTSRDFHLFRRGQRAQSDMFFRKQYGGSLSIALPATLHLEHNRDKEARAHLSEQR